MAQFTMAQLGQRIREARERQGTKQADFAKLVPIDRTALNKIEAGQRKVSALELVDIARAAGVRMATFFEEPPLAVIAHRSAQGLDTADSRIDTLLAGLAEDVEFVQKLLPFMRPAPESPWDPPSTLDDCETMASKVREVLHLTPQDPLTNLSGKFAELGLLLFTFPLGIDQADAGTLLLSQGGVSLINSTAKVGRRRLAACHELAHFLTADDYTIDWRVAAQGGDLESHFDRFARALLLPHDGVATLWDEVHSVHGTRTAAVILASRYQVDMSTLARRLQDLEVLDASGAGDVRQVRTTSADLIEHDLYPGDELAEVSQPRPYQQAVLALIREERISRERGLELLGGILSEDDLPEPALREEHALWDYVS